MNKIDYKIQKVETKVDILMDSGQTTEVEEYILFLDEFSRYRKGKETIYEYLNKNQENQFVPMKDCRSGEFVILNLADIVYVREKEKFSTPSPQKVLLYFKDNRQLEVDHINPLPDSQSRVLDYLNQDVKFILFYHDKRKIFVNKNKIVFIRNRSGNAKKRKST